VLGALAARRAGAGGFVPACYRSNIENFAAAGRKGMRAFQACLALALVTGIPFGANAQSTESVVKFPNDMEFKAPLSAAPQVAVLYGDPTKADVYVTRIKLAPGLKVTPHWHPDPWRTVVVLSGTLYFGVGEQWDESKLKAYPAGTF
jgi:hypothetical protein